jgi:hypothetical protein
VQASKLTKRGGLSPQLVARSLSRQVRAARLTPKARSFQCEVTCSTAGLARPTPHPWPARALAPIVAAALVARPHATQGATGADRPGAAEARQLLRFPGKTDGLN